MSILQDLDPQYAKIHTQSSSTRKPVIMACAALVALGGAYWVMMKTASIPTNQTHAEYPVQPPASTDTVAKPPSAAPGAMIREEPQRTSGMEQRTPMSPPGNSPESATESLADAEYRRQTQAIPSHAKTAPTHGVAKPERRSATAQQATKGERNQPSSGKRTNERDIDIITAIVR